jgi:hypothetical protein
MDLLPVPGVVAEVGKKEQLPVLMVVAAVPGPAGPSPLAETVLVLVAVGVLPGMQLHRAVIARVIPFHVAILQDVAAG